MLSTRLTVTWKKTSFVSVILWRKASPLRHPSPMSPLLLANFHLSGYILPDHARRTTQSTWNYLSRCMYTHVTQGKLATNPIDRIILRGEKNVRFYLSSLITYTRLSSCHKFWRCIQNADLVSCLNLQGQYCKCWWNGGENIDSEAWAGQEQVSKQQ